MLHIKHILYAFVPAILLGAVVLFVRVIQYQPLYPEQKDTKTEPEAFAEIPVFPDDPIIGEKKAPITLVAFEDFGCPGCQEQNELFKELEARHPGRVKIIWKGLPVTQFPFSSEDAERYGYCANRQGQFEEFKELAFANNTDLSPATLDVIAGELDINGKKFDECLQSADPDTYIERVKQLARILQVQQVPTFFLNGKQIITPRLAEGWEQALGLTE